MMRTARWIGWSVALGFALGGFFDGILLHQILQWHHLLSLVPGLGDLRLQVLWDGYFHALMYLVALIGLWGLWRARGSVAADGARRLWGSLLLGFGAWHIADSVLSHWLLGIHRIKLDSPNPLLWDLAWFALFGLGPLALGWLLLRRGGGSPRRQGAALALALLTLGTAGAGAWALRSPPDLPFTVVVFRSGLGPDGVRAAIDAQDGRLIWADPLMNVVVVEVPPERRWGFYGRGALLVGGSGLPAGCLDWTRT